MRNFSVALSEQCVFVVGFSGSSYTGRQTYSKLSLCGVKSYFAGRCFVWSCFREWLQFSSTRHGQ